ncbi:hypothetical protein F4X33_02480, partial [Candidatus Poribacteria bacterium]|nr:hypothetical protein [Candidatus Poribacteria bacterium]
TAIYPHMLAFLYKSVSFFFPRLEQVAIFSSLLFFGLSLLVFYLLIHRLLGWQTALLATNLCVVVPPTLIRSVVGYVDRDAFCLFLGLSSYYLYMRAYQSDLQRNRLVWGFLSGVVMALLGLTWQGVGLFMSVIVLLNFILFLLPTYRQIDFYLFLAWLIPVLIGLLGFKSVYRDLSQAYAMLAIVLPCGFLTLFIGAAIISKQPRLAQLCTLSGKIPLSFTVTVITVGLGSFALLFSSDVAELMTRAWTHFLAPFGSGRLAASIGELQKRDAIEWSVWPGYFFIFAVGGALLFMKMFASTARLNVWMSLVLFEVLLAGTILTRFALTENSFYDSTLMTVFYASSLIVFTVGMTVVYLWSYYRQREMFPKNQPDIKALFLLVLFCVLLFITRGAMRFEFFFAPVVMALGCYAFIRSLKTLKVPDWGVGLILLSLFAFECYAIREHLPILNLPDASYYSLTVPLFMLIIAIGPFAVTVWRASKSAIIGTLRISTLALLILLLLFLGGSAPVHWLGGYADSSYTQASEIRSVFTPAMSRALEWLKHNTSQSSTVAAWWDNGSFINLLSDRATIIDEEQLPYWVHLTARDVLLQETDSQALQFLKAHEATHLLITGQDLQSSKAISILASDKVLDRHLSLALHSTTQTIIQSQSDGSIFKYTPEAEGDFMSESITINGKTYPTGTWKINGTYLKLDSSNGDTAELQGILIEIVAEGEVLQLMPERFYYKEIMYQQSGKDILPCTLLISSHTDNPLDWAVFCLSPKIRDTLMFRLYLLNQASDYFRPVYPPEIAAQQGDLDPTDFSVRIWEIHCPDNLLIDPKYLETDFPDAELRRLWKK